MKESQDLRTAVAISEKHHADYSNLFNQSGNSSEKINLTNSKLSDDKIGEEGRVEALNFTDSSAEIGRHSRNSDEFLSSNPKTREWKSGTTN